MKKNFGRIFRTYGNCSGCSAIYQGICTGDVRMHVTAAARQIAAIQA